LCLKKFLFWKLSLSNDQSWKIISESSCATSLFHNGMWYDKMIDLGSGGTGTNTDSGIWLKLSKSFGVKIGKKLGPNQKIRVHTHFSLTEYDFENWLFNFRID